MIEPDEGASQDGPSGRRTESRGVSASGIAAIVAAVAIFLVLASLVVLSSSEWVLNPRYWPVLLALLLVVLGALLWLTVSKKPAARGAAAVLVGLLVLVGLAGIWLNWRSALFLEQVPLQSASVHQFTPAELASQWTQVTLWDGQMARPVSDTIQPYPHGPGVAYDLEARADKELEYDIKYALPVRADGVTAHFRLPKEPALETNWVGLAAVDQQDRWLASAGRPITNEEWVPITLDLRGQYDSGSHPLNAGPVSLKAVFRLKRHPSVPGNTVRAGLAGVSIYPDLGALSIREQRGAKRVLLDFDSEGSGGDWQAARVEADRLAKSPDIVYRGTKALEMDTAGIGGADYATISTQQSISSPSGIWLAQVYLSGAGSPPARVWAKLHSVANGAWVASDPQYLTPESWNTVVWDTRGIDWGAQQDITLGIQFGAEGIYRGPLYVDNFQVYEK